MDNYIEKVKESTSFIQSKIKDEPQVGIILGTGLGQLINDLQIDCTLSYDDIPNFPVSTVESHHGKLVFGKLNGKSVVAMQGRFHYYEGHSMKEVTFPVRVLKLLGIKTLLLSNAAGGLNADMNFGDLMIINDHINLHHDNPLRGVNADEFGPRFPDMSEPYSLTLITHAARIATDHHIPYSVGVYASLPGPNLETKAEYNYLHTIGANAVGMSTVPEVIVARHMELPCFALSVITNVCYPVNRVKHTTVEDVINVSRSAEQKMSIIFRELMVYL